MGIAPAFETGGAEVTVKIKWAIAALAAAELGSGTAAAQSQIQTPPVYKPPEVLAPVTNTRATRRTLNAENCRLDFAMVNDVPLRVYVPRTRNDSIQAAGAATSVIAAGDTTGANCFVTTFFSQYEPASYYFQPQPVTLTVTPATPATPIGFVPRKIIMSSTSGGEVALPFKPSPDSGVIKRVKRP
jgi:hypothetical protein